MLWPYVLTIVGGAGFWLTGKKVWWAWYINIANQGLWTAYALLTEQLGFLIGVGFYMVVFIKNAISWTKERFPGYYPSKTTVRRWNYPESTPMRKLRGPYACLSCGVDEYEWCKDDCEYLDPYDWR